MEKLTLEEAYHELLARNLLQQAMIETLWGVFQAYVRVLHPEMVPTLREQFLEHGEARLQSLIHNHPRAAAALDQAWKDALKDVLG